MFNDLFSIGSVTIHMYGVMVALGVVAAVTVGMIRAKRKGLSSDEVTGLALYGILCGVAGAKLMYCIVHFREFLEDPSMLWSTDGFLMYGAILVAIVFCLVYCRVRKLSFIDYFDLCIPSVMLAQGIGRFGCFFAGCCYGKETDSCIGIIFPQGSIAPAGVKLWPTQLLSAGGDLLFAALLMAYGSRKSSKGTVGLAYLALYGVGRFAIDFYRADGQNVVNGVSVSQVLSAVMSIVGILGIAAVHYLRRKGVLKYKEQTKAEAEILTEDNNSGGDNGI